MKSKVMQEPDGTLVLLACARFCCCNLFLRAVQIASTGMPLCCPEFINVQMCFVNLYMLLLFLLHFWFHENLFVFVFD